MRTGQVIPDLSETVGQTITLKQNLESGNLEKIIHMQKEQIRCVCVCVYVYMCVYDFLSVCEEDCCLYVCACLCLCMWVGVCVFVW